jgi:hypothetical protein
LSKIGSNARFTSEKKRGGRKKGNEPPPEIDIMSILSSDDEPVKKPAPPVAKPVPRSSSMAIEKPVPAVAIPKHPKAPAKLANLDKKIASASKAP